MTLEIAVENIKCVGCANSIESALLKLDGVEQVAVNVVENLIAVSGNPDKLEVSDRLKELGYPAKGSNSILSKAKSYVSCALGRMGRNG
ncbi:MAG: heavy-metal-associated domain-containing protein [Flavobacterium sp.]|nr:MAG: heavy-metal-associated domain-containing protein [Flavobacterium sp.]